MIKFIFCVFALIAPQLAFSETDSSINTTAHISTSFALQTVFYGFNEKVLHLSKLDSELIALMETLAIGGFSAPLNSAATFENTAGAFTAIATHIVFKF